MTGIKPGGVLIEFFKKRFYYSNNALMGRGDKRAQILLARKIDLHSKRAGVTLKRPGEDTLKKARFTR